MKSAIFLSERINNTSRRFGQDTHYFPCIIVMNNRSVNALFTADQIRAAMLRARSNPEDCHDIVSAWNRLLSRLFGKNHAHKD